MALPGRRSSPTGGFYQRFAQQKLPTGEYAARFEDADGESLAEVPFRMEAYRLPLFEVRLHGPDTTALDRDVTINLTAAYYAGGKVAGRPLQWRVTQFPYAWTPERRPGFLYSSDGRFSKTGRFESTPALVRQDATDADGGGRARRSTRASSRPPSRASTSSRPPSPAPTTRR